MDAAQAAGRVFRGGETIRRARIDHGRRSAIGAAVLDTLPSLRAIICYGTAYDGVDLAAAASAQDRGWQ